MTDLLGFFITNFDIQVIYEAGWKAAQGWTAMVSGLVLALAIAIRTVQEQLGGAKADWMSAIKDFALYGVLTSTLFLFIFLLIEFFNGVYGTLSASSAPAQLGKSLNTVFDYWSRAKFEFSLTDLANGFYGAFAFSVFIITYMVLVFVVFALRISHAILVTLSAFWAAVAIPMAPVNGLNSLKSLKVIVLVAFIWPIIDAFFLFLVASVFADGLEKAFEGHSDTITAGEMVFVLFVYSVINMFMIAASLAAVFVAQGLADGKGNVTGMMTSFAGAGVGAGLMAAKYGAHAANTAGAAAGGKARDGANKLGGVLNDKFGLSSGHEAPSANPRGEAAEAFDKNKGFNDETPTPEAKPTPETKPTPEKVSEDKAPETSSDTKPETNNSVQSSKGSGGGSSASSNTQDGSTAAAQATTDGGNTAPTPTAAGQTNTNSNLTAESSTGSGGGGSNADNAAAKEVERQAGHSSESSTQPTADGRAASGGAGSHSLEGGKGFDESSTEIGEEQAAQAKSETTDNEGLASDEADKKKQQRRGAIINQGRGKQ